MAKLENYRRYVCDILEVHGQHRPAFGDVEMQLLFDTERDHYQLMSVGWNGQQRIYGLLIHINIKNDKIWIQHDGTEGGVANELIEFGVPKEDIVLAFHAPFSRQYTGFATGVEIPASHAA